MSLDNFNKLIESIAAETGYDEEQVKSIVLDYFEKTAFYLKEETMQSIPHIGTFKLRWQDEYQMFNPKLNREMIVDAHYLTRFHGASDFQEKINELTEQQDDEGEEAVSDPKDVSASFHEKEIQNNRDEKETQQQPDIEEESSAIHKDTADVTFEGIEKNREGSQDDDVPEAAKTTEAFGEKSREDSQEGDVSEAVEVTEAFEEKSREDSQEGDVPEATQATKAFEKKNSVMKDINDEVDINESVYPPGRLENSDTTKGGGETTNVSEDLLNTSGPSAADTSELSGNRHDLWGGLKPVLLPLLTALGIFIILMIVINVNPLFKSSNAAKASAKKNVKAEGGADFSHAQKNETVQETSPERPSKKQSEKKGVSDVYKKNKTLPAIKEKFIVFEWGDTLKKIAAREYGSSIMWPYIYYENIDTITSPDKIIPVQDRIILRYKTNRDLGELYFNLYLYFKKEGQPRRAERVLKTAYELSPRYVANRRGEIDDIDFRVLK